MSHAYERQVNSILDGQISVMRLDPSDRWRTFAVAACESLAQSEQEVALYAAQLRARRSAR